MDHVNQKVHDLRLGGHPGSDELIRNDQLGVAGHADGNHYPLACTAAHLKGIALILASCLVCRLQPGPLSSFFSAFLLRWEWVHMTSDSCSPTAALI